MIIYMTTVEAASYLKLSRRYMEDLRKDPSGPPFVAFGKAIRYRQQDLDEWAAKKVRATRKTHQ